MATYSFTVTVAGFKSLDGAEKALFEHGCDDALLVMDGIEMKLDFDREAVTYDIALMSALRDIREAGGEILRVEHISD